MTALCTGLAILGLCIPLPGHSRSTIEESGWSLFDRDQPSWSASQTLASGTYAVTVLLTGQNDTISGVLLLELRSVDRDSERSPLLTAFKKACRDVKGIEVCTFGKFKVQRHSCGGGWAIAPIGAWTEKSLADCARWAPLFEDALKK